jgi:O-antigen ligase
MKPQRQMPRLLTQGSSSAFWNVSLSRWEWGLLLVALGVSVVLHLTPVLQSGLAKPLVFALAALCFLSPTTGFFFIGASSILPSLDPAVYAAVREAVETGGTMPASSVDATARFGFIAWAVVTPLKYRRYSLGGLVELWPILPWFLWIMVTSGYREVANEEVLKALLYCVMACQLANESKGQYLKCLLGLCLGCLVIIVGYWASVVGLPVTLSDWGGEREGFERLGSVRADSVMLWPPLLVGLAGLLGALVGLGSRLNPLQLPKWLAGLVLTLFVASLPPLVASMTHGAFVGLGLVLAGLAASLTLGGRRPDPGGVGLSTALSVLLVGLLAAGLMFATNAFEIRSRAAALFSYYRAAAEDTGAAASRTGVWEASLDTIRRYPLMGVEFNHGVETVPAEYAGRGSFLSHNVFLDYGRSSGIPGMLLLAWFFFRPMLRVFGREPVVPYMPFLLAHFAFLVFFMSLSFPFYKAFWGFWMLMALAVARGSGPRLAVSRVRRRRSARTPLSSVAGAVVQPAELSAPAEPLHGTGKPAADF